VGQHWSVLRVAPVGRRASWADQPAGEPEILQSSGSQVP
jgi:hypothetical protein